MKIPNEVIKTVAFVAFRDLRDGTVKPVGSMFFLGNDPEEGAATCSRVFAVTARHVIEGLGSKGCDTCILRLNPKDKNASTIEVEVPLSAWHFHPTDPTVDVATLEHHIPATADHLAIPFRLGADKEKFEQNEVDLGDEVFVSGLFVHHFGARRNIPIVRIGNLAALNEEKVQTKRDLIDAYLVELRSIGGLSGSPVFLHLGAPRMIGGGMTISGTVSCLLLGLIHGHFDVIINDMLSDNRSDNEIRESVNAGIAIVVPFEKILEVVKHVMDTETSTGRIIAVNFTSEKFDKFTI